MTWRVLIAAVVAVFIGGVLLFAGLVQLPTVDDATLAQRCAQSAPTWEGYPEEIKGQVGAAPVAEWTGTPVAAALDAGQLQLTIQLEGPWVDRPFGLPILVRDPYGKTHLSRDARGEGPRRTYYFDLSGGGALTWLEVVTPEGRRRITLGPDHSWNGD